jgi:proline iminopeptidase
MELGIDRWLVWGGSWGTTLGLAYAESHPESVSELVLSSVVSTSSADVEWVTRTMGRIFPEQWRAFRDHLSPDRWDGNLAQAYNDLLMDPDPAVHNPAALAWCDWEDVHVSLADGYQPDLRNADPAFRLCFARIVTHYWANAAFLSEGHLLENATRLADIPTFLSHGRMDVSSPIDFPVALVDAIGDAQLFIAERDGHGGSAMTDWTVSVTDRLAETPRT